jgi:hypothetical protein
MVYAKLDPVTLVDELPQDRARGRARQPACAAAVRAFPA